MSHSSGNVTFKKDNLVMYCEYDGTVDIMVPALWDTQEEMSDHWRESIWNKCTCGNMEPVIIHSDYGGGFSWEGEACRTCKAINHEHLESDWEAEKAYREQRNNPWGLIDKESTLNLTAQNAQNFNSQLEQVSEDLEKALESYIGQPVGVLNNIILSDLAKEIFEQAAMLPPMDLVVRNVRVREGAKPLRTNKKRIVKKWCKKNLIVEDETLFSGCTIIGGDL